MTAAPLIRPLTRPWSALRAFLVGEAGGGVVLLAAALAAMVVANWPATAHGYEALLAAPLGPLDVHQWINDGLMAVFFLLVGLEIKRELIGGQLASARRRRLPVLVAAAGMAAPALVFLLVTAGHPGLQRGWAIPAATDIAFAIGILALLGSRAPAPLKIFLTAVAIVDDMGAVAIIALAYTTQLNGWALALAAGIVAGLVALNRRKVGAVWPYLAGFALLWVAVLLSGIHATVAGVVAAACIPLGHRPGQPDDAQAPLHRIEHAISAPVLYGIVPLFAFANAGVSLAGLGWGALADPLVLGIVGGLFLGKQAGVMAAVWLAERFGWAHRPGGAGWGQVYGVALLAGVGFTMSLFIGGLAFPAAPQLMGEVKLGVLAGSLLSAVAGYLVLRGCAMTPPCDASSIPSS